MVDIEIGHLYFPALPKNHPLREYCDKYKYDMFRQDELCKVMMACIEEFWGGLSTQRNEDFKEVADARESSFRDGVLTEDGAAALLTGSSTEGASERPRIVGPNGEPLL
jgi:hypothetical protein